MNQTIDIYHVDTKNDSKTGCSNMRITGLANIEVIEKGAIVNLTAEPDYWALDTSGVAGAISIIFGIPFITVIYMIVFSSLISRQIIDLFDRGFNPEYIINQRNIWFVPKNSIRLRILKDEELLCKSFQIVSQENENNLPKIVERMNRDLQSR